MGTSTFSTLSTQAASFRDFSFLELKVAESFPTYIFREFQVSRLSCDLKNFPTFDFQEFYASNIANILSSEEFVKIIK